MSKPDWCPQSVWDEADRRAVDYVEWLGEYIAEGGRYVLAESIARAILAAEKHGEEREREACAALADEFEPIKRLLPYLSHQENEAAQVGQSEAADDIASAIRKRGTP